MTHTYYQLLYHLVWVTKERRSLIRTDLQNRLYEYMGGTFRELKCYPLLIGGMPDHIHACVEIPSGTALSDVLRTVKVSSTKWIRENFPLASEFAWQEGYGAFSVSVSSKEAVLRYISNQEEQHKKYDFREEFLLLLRNHGVSYDEKYLWKSTFPAPAFGGAISPSGYFPRVAG